jgi:glycine cleavage system H protein
MAEVRGCQIPEDLYYWPDKHVWARPEPDGTVTIGITDTAQHLAKTIISVTPRGVGRSVQRGRSAGTLESGKWVGPVTSPVSGEIVAVNEAAVANPRLLNDDPYGAGWFARIRPSDWATESRELVTGIAAVAAYRDVLEREGISCA